MARNSAASFAVGRDRALGDEEDRARQDYIKEHTPKEGYATDELGQSRKAYERQVVETPEDMPDIVPDSYPTAEATARINRALAVAERVHSRLSDWKKKRDDKDWGLKMIAGFEAATTEAAEYDGSEIEDGVLDHRAAQAKMLAEFHSNYHGPGLDTSLEKAASFVFGQNDRTGNYSQAVAGKLRGYFFEVLSQSLPINSENTATLFPNRGQPEKEQARALKDLEGAAVRSSGSLGISRSEVVAKLVLGDLQKTDEYKAADADENFFIQTPSNKAGAEAALRRGAAMIWFKADSDGKRWVTGRHNPRLDALAAKATEINNVRNQQITQPDNIITRGDQVVGFVEAKCWPEYEVAAFVELLENQKGAERYGSTIGGVINGDVLNAKRAEANLPPLDYPADGFRFQLKLDGERNFIAAACDLDETQKRNLLAAVRLPAGISPELITRLQAELEKRGERVIIEQVKTLTAEETEQVATSLIESPSLAARLAKKYEENTGGRHADKMFNLRNNLQARAVALGIRSWEELGSDAIPSHTTEAGLVFGEEPVAETKSGKVTSIEMPSLEERAAAAKSLDEAGKLPVDEIALANRAALVLQLRKDYLASQQFLERR